MNPIGSQELLHTNVGGVADLDTPARFAKVLSDDMLRLVIYDRVKSCIEDYRKQFGAEPLWVRISYDIISRNGPPLFKEGETVCGLLFRTLLEENDAVEVGASVREITIQA